MAARRRTRSKAAPGYIPELDPMEAKSPPAGLGWVHEVKWDGFRAQAHLRNGKATTYSRSGLNWLQEFDTGSEAVAKLKAKARCWMARLSSSDRVANPIFRPYAAISTSTRATCSTTPSICSS